MGLYIDSAAYSHIGGRKNNEDSFFLNGVYLEREKMDAGGQCSAVYGQHVQIYAVCDGMGGAMYGEEASCHAVKKLGEHLEKCANPCDTNAVKTLLNDISDGINSISEKNGLKHGASGTTIAMLMVQDGSFRTVNVGDSRIYLLRGGRLRQITKDHSHVQALLDSGMITPEAAWRHPQKNIILQHLGMEEEYTMRPDISSFEPLQDGDKFLICSDGLSDVVRDDELERLLLEAESPIESAGALVRRALKAASEYDTPSDNVTVVRFDVCQEDDGGRLRKLRRLMRLRRLISGALAVCTAAAAAMVVEIARFILH